MLITWKRPKLDEEITLTHHDIWNFFSKIGWIQDLEVKEEKGRAILTFSNFEEAELALSWSKKMIKDQVIEVK